MLSVDGAAGGDPPPLLPSALLPNPATLCIPGRYIPAQPGSRATNDKTLHVRALWRTLTSAGVARRSRNSLIAAYTYAIMSYNTVLSCIREVGLPPLSAASMQRPVPPFMKASRAPLSRRASSARLQTLIPALRAGEASRINPRQFFCTTCVGDKGSRRIQMGRRLPLFPDPSCRRGNAPGLEVGAIGSLPVARPVVSLYLHTCAKLIKAELIRVLVIF